MSRKHVNLGRAPAKGDLPTKACAACGLPFSWRRKWARDWDQVKFCSDRCREKDRVLVIPPPRKSP
ncbi:DUF2256 domain-containing protein [Brevundimonas sp. FT23028]|uniref:DUF2256 domain-containing protein n=1 Tax=Brevundimonas sp. FT23028 TaxID=3393748 RepID=UPI003B586A69